MAEPGRDSAARTRTAPRCGPAGRAAAAVETGRRPSGLEVLVIRILEAEELCKA